MSKEHNWVPWYRRKDYDGNLTEEEKRILDSFRMTDKHPAANYDDLPNEVRRYINGIELELYDRKQDNAVSNAFFLSAVAAFLIFLAYTGQAYSTINAYLLGAIVFITAWVRYRWVWNKNAEEFLPQSEGAPNQTDEGIRKEWELCYIVNLERQKSEFEDTP